MRTPVYILIFTGRVEKTYPLPRGEGGRQSRVGRLRPQARAASNRRRRLLASAGIRAETYDLK